MVYQKIAILRFFTFFDILLSRCLISVQSGRHTPMHYACMCGHLDFVKVLHSAGADTTSIKDSVSS